MPGPPLTIDAPAAVPASNDHAWAFRTDIEGLRAVAIAAVVGYHVGLPLFGGGFVGVDVFFVISGFLITGLLAAEARATGGVALAKFWARRARRLLPAATLVLTVVAALSWWATPSLDHPRVGTDILASAFYVSNMRFASQMTDYLASDATDSPVLHFWSLGVEEQFYVIWPLLVIAVVALVIRSCRKSGSESVRLPLMVTLTALGIVSFLLSLRLTDRIEPWAFFGMPTRAWEFAIGGLLSLGTLEIARLAPAVRRALGLAGGVVLLGSIVVITNDMPYPGTAALWPVLGTAAILAAGCGDQGASAGIPTLLSAWAMRALGRLSYSWYLWHWPALVLAAAVWGDVGVPVKLVLVLLALIPSALAYRFVEQPLHHLPSLVTSPRRSLLLGGVLSVTAALAGVALAFGPAGGAHASTFVVPTSADEQTGRGPAALAGASSSASPTASASASPSPSGSPVAAIVWPTGSLTPSPAKARGDIPVIYSDGCHLQKPTVSYVECAFGDTSSSTVVVLFGDSHAAQWFPALETLAKQHHWRLLVRTKSGCPAPDVTIFDRGLKRAYDECDSWRTAVLAELVASHPALVVAAGTRTASLVDRATGSKIAASAAPGEWQAGWARELGVLSDAGVAVAVLRDTPWPGRDVPACVARNSANPSACDLSRDALDSAAYDTAMTKGHPTAHGVDLTSVICDSSRCPATLGKYLVYRDTSHLTATFVRALAPYLDRQLAPLLP